MSVQSLNAFTGQVEVPAGINVSRVGNAHVTAEITDEKLARAVIDYLIYGGSHFKAALERGDNGFALGIRALEVALASALMSYEATREAAADGEADQLERLASESHRDYIDAEFTEHHES